MKFSNPFDRRKNVDSVPYSVFPASKRVRTSMQIGRAVPVYTIDMVQGNHIKLSASDAVRFMTMNRPVMNDFEVTFGAYFVPYVALDELTRSSVCLRDFPELAPIAVEHGLNAREFFNPATPDSKRVHPISLPFSAISNVAKSGCLYEHLGYSIMADVQLAGKMETYSEAGSTSFKIVSDLFKFGVKVSGTSLANVFTYVKPMLNYGSASVKLMPFDVWVLKNGSFGPDFDSIPTVLTGSTTTYASYINGITNGLLAVETVHTWLSGSVDAPISPNWKTLDACFAGYRDYLITECRKTFGGSFTANVTRWLAYQRIYADYFLNDLYVEHDNYIALIAQAYLRMVETPGQTVFDVFDNIYPSSELIFFKPYLQYGECMPVRWALDPITALQRVEASGGNVTISSGDSIPTLFYKRMLQKFRDLVARMGMDYKDNTFALYGSRVPDSTLQRSQCIGLKSFDVKISAIAQTGADTSTGNTGDFAGVGYTAGSTDSWEWTAEENGLIMVLCWIRPKDIAYCGIVDRSILKSQYTDYLLPQFGGVGYQDVPLRQLSPSAPASFASNVVGIQERYFEYMMMNNEVSGAFLNIARPYTVDRAVTTDWRMLYSSSNQKPFYITENDDINHIFSDTVNDPVLVDIKFIGTVTRQLPAYMRTDF